MKRRHVFAIFALLALFSGCSHAKKAERAKKNLPIAADTDQSFFHRFVDRRIGELVAQGVPAETARAQAVEEFKVRYNYTSAAKK